MIRKVAWCALLLLTAQVTAIPDGNYSLAQPVTGTMSVNNWPGNYPITGSVAVSNFPASQAVSGTFWPVTQPVSGSVSVLNFPSFPASQAVTGTFWQATQPVSGTFWPSATTAIVSRVAVGTVAVTLLVANPNRKRAIIFNETGTLRVKLGANATLTDYTYEILASAGNNRQDVDTYTGAITAIKTSGASFVQVTEL